MTRLTGVGGRDSRRRAYKDVFTASCRASDRTLTNPSHFNIYWSDDSFFMNATVRTREPKREELLAIDRHTPYPEYGEIPQTGNCCYNCFKFR